MLDRFSLEGRVALVTGSSRGIGFVVARCLAEAGARVVLNGRDPKTLTPQVQALREQGYAADALPADITDTDAVASAVRSIVDRHGRLDVLVNNAGIIHRQEVAGVALDDWRRVVETNLTATFVVSQAAARIMVAAGWGRIVNMASILGLVGREMVSSYVASKHGIIGLTRSLAAELGPKGITCNAIAPGYIRTEINVELQRNEAFDTLVRTRTPVGRWGEPEEVAAAALFLALPAAAYINGHVLVVDGGMIETL